MPLIISRSPGFAHGFFYSKHRDFSTFTHGGDTIYFHSLGGFIPEYDFSFFLSNNTSTGMEAIFELMSNFYSTFFPESTGAELSDNYTAIGDLKKYIGTYLVNRHSESDISKLLKLTMKVSVRLSSEGGLEITDFMNSANRYVETDKNIFQEENGTGRIIFLEDEKGNIQSLIMDLIPAFLFNRSIFLEKIVLNAIIVLFLIVSLLFCFISAPTGLIAQFKNRYHQDRFAYLASTNALILTVSYFFFFISIIIFLVNDFVFNLPNIAIIILPYVLLILTLFMIIFTILSWLKKWWHLPGRTIYTTLTVSSLLFQIFLLVWKFF